MEQKQLLMQDEDGQVVGQHSILRVLDYPGLASAAHLFDMAGADSSLWRNEDAWRAGIETKQNGRESSSNWNSLIAIQRKLNWLISEEMWSGDQSFRQRATKIWIRILNGEIT